MSLGGLKLGSFGFVFSGLAEAIFFVTHFFIVVYVHFSIWQIGFVLHNLLKLIDFANPSF